MKFRFKPVQSFQDCQGNFEQLETKNVLDSTPMVVLPLSGDTTGVTDRNALAALIAQLGANGGIIQLQPGTTYVDQMSALAGTSNIWLRGSGDGATALVFTSASGIADLTATSFFTCSDMLIRPSIQRTAEYFHLDAGGGSSQHNRFQRLRVSSPYRLATLLTTTTNLFEDIQFLDSAAWTYNAGISLDGAATSTIIRGLRGGTAFGISTALVNITGTGVDTVLADDWDILNTGGTGMAGLIINSANAEWLHFSNISIESGTTANAVSINGAGSGTNIAKGITFQGVHLLGQRGLFIGGGRGIEVVGGEILACQQEGIRAVAFAPLQDVTLSALDVSDTGLQTTNTYNAIYFTGGFSYFKVIGCSAGNNRLLGSANRAKNGCQIDAGSNFYIIQGNQFEGATGGLLDNGGGANKAVGNNI